MTKSIGCVVVCLLGMAGCSFERYDDCEGDYHYQDDGDRPSKPIAGSPGVGGRGPSSGGSSSAGEPSLGGSASGGASGGANGSSPSGGGAGAEPGMTCEEERDCRRGYNCDLEQHECVPADAETCPELESEAACTNRRDCVPIYGGVNCSCGQDCECKGGEPGCICESFDFVSCQATE